MIALVASLAAYFFSWSVLYFLVPRLGSQLLDYPNNRSSHHLPTPRGGGVVFLVTASLASFLALWYEPESFSHSYILTVAPLITLPLAFVGFLDDRLNLPASFRYVFQIATASVVILVSPLSTPSLLMLPVSVLLIVAVTAVINFTNFMDGLDGLVAGCMAVVITAASVELAAPWPIWCLVGSLLGFLLWNWSPAKVFMGDVGSTYLGAIFSILILQASSWSEAFALLLIATPLLADACICVLRRLITGQQVFQAHRLHLFQRLHQVGWSHAHVSILYISSTSVLAIALFCGGLSWVIGFAALELLIGFWLDQKVAVPFAVASRN